MKRTIPIFLALILALTLPVFAQEDEEGEQEKTIEELYLSRNAEVQIVRYQANSQDRDTKMLALQTLRSMHEAGRIDPDDPLVMNVVDNLASEGVDRQIRENKRVTNYFPEIRRQAAGLLGDIGGELAVQSLRDIMTSDPEPMVLSEAAYALGKIGSDQSGEATEVIAWALNRENSKRKPDDNFAFAALLATEKLAESNGGLNDPELFDAILEINSANYIKTVKLKAIDVIYNLRQYQ
ncbi:MAG: HEAT repeat domain-containing protein [Spirochaetales bacterium]|nr:HEAT repeat domain-containing protein [Spirochaetales bacterium]